MATSKSFANKLNLFRLAIGGASQYEKKNDENEKDNDNGKKLPAEATVAANNLSALVSRLDALNVEQEAAKKRLKSLTAEINALLKDGSALRGKIVKFAEGAFGSRAPELDQFRPRTEGKIKKPKKTAA